MLHVTVDPALWPDPLAVAHCVAAEYPPPVETSHWYEYVEVPVEEIIPLTVRGWLVSTAVDETAGAAGAVSCEATAIVDDAAEVTVSGVFAESVTWSLNAYVSPAVSVPPLIVHVSGEDAAWPVPLFVAQKVETAYAPPFTETIQLYEYGEVPVDGIAPVTVSAWFTSSAVALTVGAAGAVSCETTLTVEDAADVAVSGVFAESVTLSSNA
jgi:hypothetical protein